ncbi:hypothetical protein Golob_002087, partial [Gossypium lobatum]|nr:hypothetical protein [Gossypium lobatum]
MCTSPAVYPNHCGVGEAPINDDVNTRKGETSSTVVIMAIPIADRCRKPVKKAGKNEHHLWEKRDSASSGQKEFNLVRIVSQLPNEKETHYTKQAFSGIFCGVWTTNAVKNRALA